MKAPDKVYIDDLAVINDCATKISLKQLPNFSEYIRKDALVDKLYKWMDEETTVTDYYSKEDFKKVIDNLF